MKLVIDIPEETYNLITTQWKKPKYIGAERLIYEWITEGTPLPKGHGRLIDADALKMDTRVCGDRYLSRTSLFVANKVIEQAPTIIEADKGESEE